MKPSFCKTRAHLLVCTSQQCATRGSRILFQTLWQFLEGERLAYYAGGGLRLTESGCLGACQFGPNATCYFKPENGNLEEAWYYGLDYPKILSLARALNAGEELPLEQRYDITASFSSSNASSSVSFKTFTPSSPALSSLEPAASPAIK